MLQLLRTIVGTKRTVAFCCFVHIAFTYVSVVHILSNTAAILDVVFRCIGLGSAVFTRYIFFVHFFPFVVGDQPDAR